jgi:2-keto-4-pentenoate hydratase/2-oxohepta-3-ene-1,7-dioic acid hydratase in catechol pathway
MRLATIVVDGHQRLAVVRDGRVLSITERETGWASPRSIAAVGQDAVPFIDQLVAEYGDGAWQSLDAVAIAPAVPDPGGIYTIGLNYDGPGAAPRPDRPLVYAKAPSSVAANGDRLTWDRELTANVDAEVELGIVMGEDGGVFGYTIIDDISSRDPWLDGDQWLLGKSMPGFCPVGPVVVTADEFDPTDVRLGCTINGEPIQDGRTSDMRFSIPDLLDYLGRHVRLEPGDLIATGTPVRLSTPPGPDRHLQAGDIVTCWIEGIGELTTHIG